MATPVVDRDKWEWVPGALAIFTTALVGAAILLPYFWTIPKDNSNIVIQAQTTLWNGWLVILGYFFGNAMKEKKKDDTINVQAKALTNR